MLWIKKYTQLFNNQRKFFFRSLTPSVQKAGALRREAIKEVFKRKKVLLSVKIENNSWQVRNCEN